MAIKNCKACNKEKFLEEFNKDPRNKDGRGAKCKSCSNKYNRKWRENNRESDRESKRNWLKRNPEYKRNYYIDHQEEIKQRVKEWRESNKEYCKEKGKEYYENNKDHCKQINAQWRENNKEYKNSVNRDWYHRNRDEVRQQHLLYQKENLHVFRKSSARRRARKLRATPNWLTEDQKEQINGVYDSCPDGYEVDHIMPLKSKDVCGLHVPWNLQHLEASENHSKGSKYLDQHASSTHTPYMKLER